MNTLASEKAVYERLYREVPEYNTYSPAEATAPLIIKLAEYLECNTILDAGCGKGQLIPLLVDKGFQVTGIDHTLIGLLPHIDITRCIEAPLSDIPCSDDFFNMVICVDVLEHIPNELLEESIKEMARVCNGYALFKIALFKDGYGKKIGEVLHKSVLPPETWISILDKYFDKVVTLEKYNGDLTVLCNG